MVAKPSRLRLGRIDAELRDVQRHFPSINATLNLRRDDFTDAVRQNMIAAYGFLDVMVRDEVDLFSDDGVEGLLHLNHLVLLAEIMTLKLSADTYPRLGSASLKHSSSM